MADNVSTTQDSTAAFEVRFLNTDEDIIEAMTAASDFSKPVYRRRLASATVIRVALLVIGALVVLNGRVAWYGWLMIGYGLSGVLTWGWILMFPKRQIMKRIQMLGIIGEQTEQVVTMDAQRVTCATERFTLSLAWEIIDSVDAGGRYIRFASRQGLIQVPTRAFENNAARASFAEAATRYYSAAAA